MGTTCCIGQGLEERQAGASIRSGSDEPPSRLSQDPVVRNEFKYDLFGLDMADVVGAIERDYAEITRPTPATLTLYFYDPQRGAPEVDPFLRLRAYADFDPATTSLEDIKALSWRVEKKCGHAKRLLGTLDGLPASSARDGEVWNLLGAECRANLLKVSQRRHFAVGEAGDESQRLTVDVTRSVFKIADHPTIPLTSSSSQIRGLRACRSTDSVSVRPRTSTRRRSCAVMPSHGTWMTWRGSISLRSQSRSAACRRVTDLPMRRGPDSTTS